MPDIINRKVIDKYVSKIKKSEMAFQKDYTSANFVFLILLGIGLMCIFLYYKYKMKLREKRRAEKEEAKRKLEEEEEKAQAQAGGIRQVQGPTMADAILNGPKVLNPHQVRNVALQPPEPTKAGAK